MLFPSFKIMINWRKKNQYQMNIIFQLQKPHPFAIYISYGVIMSIPDKIPISWKFENPTLIWFLFNKYGWLGLYGNIIRQNYMATLYGNIIWQH